MPVAVYCSRGPVNELPEGELVEGLLKGTRR